MSQFVPPDRPLQHLPVVSIAIQLAVCDKTISAIGSALDDLRDIMRDCNRNDDVVGLSYAQKVYNRIKALLVETNQDHDGLQYEIAYRKQSKDN